ncbi:MAG TPA: hypothetical protein VEW48_09025 [Thermoanaerobaculia bacterium]|nr:hypothetical protein [Thermoanaerobaculia bacterium]
MPYRRRFIVSLLLLAFCCALPAFGATRKAKVISVPKDAKDLPTAIRLVKDGDVIELAAGTYTSASGFSISNLGKAFTIRPKLGAAVILDGKGKGPILRFKNGNRSRGKRVTFQGLTFQNGVTTTEGEGGAVTLSAADARFVDCHFLRSSATGRTTGGGAVRVLAGSDATFVHSDWQGNSSGNRGGALEINFSTVTIEGGSFVENRTNLPGSKPNSSGGAIYLLDGVLRISDARFEHNQAGFVGGAIYAFGHWTDPVDVPKSDLTVVRSTFLENQACCSTASQGGAIHVENQTTLRLQHSQLIGNRAQLGGAISDYRAVVELTGSQLQGNQAFQGTALGGGGAIFASSNDAAADGVTNFRPITLTITDSLLLGAQPAAHTGGCVLAGGDASRAYGDNGVVQMGTVDENRARVEVRRSVFLDCDVQRDAVVGGGFGGAIQVNLANFLLEDSMVLISDARGEGAGGGGVSIQGETLAALTRTTFARNTAERWGGALFVSGSTLQASQCRFFANDVRPGISKSPRTSQGAGVYATPYKPETKPPERWRNVGGVVADSIFSEDLGLAIWDAEVSGPLNQMRYDNNQFFETVFGDKVYGDSAVALDGLNTAALNRLVVGATDKSVVDNQRLFAPPVAGTLLAAPGAVGTGAPAAAATLLHYAWSGRSATLDGQALTARNGLVPAGPGTHALVVDGIPAATVFLGTTTCANGAVCLASGRFEVRVEGASLLAREADTAFFSLPGGETLAVQVLDQRDKNSHFWVVRGVSNVSGLSEDLSGHTLEITDTATGTTRTWADLPDGEDVEVDSEAFSGG